ncbi:MAG: bifunctional [glutamine synthetase] adenylyltransferase/[glutamine synthetase]-adenylyl-L-tyrosine phosphorylase [Roseiarcus sp.]
MSGALADLIRTAPRLAAPAAARRRLASLAAEPAAAALAGLLAHTAARDLVLGLADHSPYLWGLVAEDPGRMARLLAAPPRDSLDRILASLAPRRDDDEAALMRALRLAKREAALLVALADIGGAWSLTEVTEALSAFADAAVACALRFLLRDNAAAGRLTIDAGDPEPEAGCGLVVLALGKHGARELNYSSDVDLIVLFDPGAPAIPLGVEPGPLFVRIARALARLLQERTGEGYVLRVDLRLRPDPGATPVALAIPSAYAYYETVGQNWERAAMIKARPVAGDLAIGARFLGALAPFIWRKYFDYGAIADIHAMKRQIHAVRGHERVTVPGHDIKLGRGGIREIEFFVQTQQLIFGGRRPRMRGARTLDMLAELHADGWVSAQAVDDLSRAYEFLRRIEHRLQMVDDEQTQRLPFEAADLARFAKFCGYPGLPAFSADLVDHLRAVETHYARLFEHAPGLDARAGNLVFTGVVDDPDTLTTLRGLGFREPERAAETIRGWHFGRRLAVRGARAREALTELTPALLDAFSRSGDPDAALAALDAALGRMTAAAELFSILRSNAQLRELFADLLGGAPRLADVIATRPHVLDGAIDPGRARLIAEGLDPALVEARVEAFVASAPTIEGVLDRTRDFAAEEMFLVGVRLLAGLLDPDRAGQAYSALAQGIARVLLAHVRRAFAGEYGDLPGGRIAVLALGKLGSREMTAASDLDLILIYDFEPGAESDGPRRLGAGQYYARLTQRLLAALTAPTRAGRLYEVDLRLRPSGRKGPVATQFAGFAQYQRDEAETWEHMALTRARVIAGDESLAAEITAAIGAVLCARREPGRVARDVRAMRALIAQEKGDSDPWDLKLVSGGLLEIEFVAQYLVLAFAHDRPGIRDVSTRAVLARAGQAGLLTPAQAEALTAAHRLFTDATQIMRLAVDGPFDPATAAGGVKRRIAAAAALPDFDALAGAVAQAREEVHGAFRDVLGAGRGK